MKFDELIALAAVSVALVAAGTAFAWFKLQPSTAAAPSTSAVVAPNPFDQFDPVALAPKELGFIDQWRFDSCMTDAAKNPTAHGVNTAARVCRRRFDQ